MGKKQVVTQELLARMVELHRAGKTGPEIAAELGIGETTVYRWLPRAGVSLQPPKGRQKRGSGNYKLDYEQELALCEQYKAGATLKELMEAYGFGSFESVRKILLRHGVQTRQQGNHTYATLDAVTKRRIVAFYKKHRSIWKVAKAVGLGTGLVRRHLVEVGLYPQTQPGTGSRWQGGEQLTRAGYRLVKLPPDHPYIGMVQANGYVLEHRLVMAEYLGRPLYEWESVHHIDGNRQHNEITNLQLRIGKHGNGVAYRCMACGSDRIEPVAFD